jgi:SSS family solute:Na+ symporter
MTINWTALVIFVLLFVFITVLGFLAAHWRRGDLDLLHEWGLGGRRFGTVVTWFLLGGDLYTAYTFIAVPALMFGAGAVGFFAVPYTIVIYPLLYLLFPMIWKVAHERGCVTAADIVHSEFGNRWLALAIAVTGLVATMPYIALQLVGMQVVIGALGIATDSVVGDLPLIIAFVILAAFTYTSGLRAPAMIAVVKDVLIYFTVLAAIIVVPLHIGGIDKIFAAVPAAKLTLAVPPAGSLGAYSNYATLALGSALALFLYPHAMTGILSSSSARVIRRNAAILPAYSLMLGLLALLGFMAIALNVQQMPEYADGFKRYGNNFSVPALFLATFPSWFVGIAFAAIAIGALVPAAIMSIAAANTWTRNVHRAFFKPNATDAEEAQMAKLVSLIVKAGALVFIFALPLEYAIQLQLLGGIWMIQIFPAVVLGLRWRFLNGWALLIGWAAGTATGTWMASLLAFKGSAYALTLFGLAIPGYAALYSLIVNIAVAVVFSLLFSAAGAGHRAVAVTR